MTDLTTHPTYTCDKLTVEYDPREDRLLCHSQISTRETVSFYVTARFVSMLVHYLFKHDALESLPTEWQSAPTRKQTPQDPVSAETVSKPSANQSSGDTSDTNTETHLYVLANRCDVSIKSAQQISIKFDLTHRFEPCSIHLAVNQTNLLQLLNIWYQKFVMAGWATYAWPGGSESVSTPHTHAQTSILH